ncbi:MAG: SUMF1/EgtB/PvdO family nonheme iron enzyme, partial [Candidatus Zophobacter franzmannii]|nr:SUMF1/EgtB/PvdO family nonheme iron enzyme [Candidatus Zophobacter franzmannii]
QFAARGGNQSHIYTYSGSNTIGGVAWYETNSEDLGSNDPDYGTHPVGTKQANELSIFDMSGNVIEWCWDIYGSYPDGSQINPTGAGSGDRRVMRSGSWAHNATICSVANRYFYTATISSSKIGFRVVRPAE